MDIFQASSVRCQRERRARWLKDCGGCEKVSQCEAKESEPKQNAGQKISKIRFHIGDSHAHYRRRYLLLGMRLLNPFSTMLVGLVFDCLIL